jgi:DNA-3-methyladenine glycosylase II
VPDHRAAVRHLRRADPVMESIIGRVGPCLLGDPTDRGGPAPDHYGALVRSIVGQQVSVHAARSMVARLQERFGGRTPTPAQILGDDPEALRAAAGLSQSKTASLRDLAAAVDSGALVLEELDELPDSEVAARLVQVRGIGQWTVDMFLIFHLGRPAWSGSGARGDHGARWPPGTSGPRSASSLPSQVPRPAPAPVRSQGRERERPRRVETTGP